MSATFPRGGGGAIDPLASSLYMMSKHLYIMVDLHYMMGKHLYIMVDLHYMLTQPHYMM